MSRCIHVDTSRQKEVSLSNTRDTIAMSIRDAVRHTGLSRSKIYQMLKTRELSSVSVGSRRLVLTQSIKDFFGKISGAAK